ncbi:MAG: Hpt domain-containing protein [Phycisphaerales bacterium]|jgi:HPt (histidine-containing phosphotransfer) domain-containing protein|nr:Hpt domain-containing protein [Phycisphaerales bacterium]
MSSAPTPQPAPRPTGHPVAHAVSAKQPLRSEFANDPDMRDIVEMYVTEMPERISQLTNLWTSQQLDELRRVAHQLKGASGGYGFPTVGKAAGKVENSLLALSDGSANASLAQLRAQVEDLINTCQRVSM